ncbi:TetR/AcrR family transcriptional regulator [Georgenia wutianyii]|uniref:TetR/AcrR family transcriptional regulator n=2 Tax=Georgenia wutianyii TaxID=2585135 RepID=A0ABX5VQS9_9MICO|nr:TetR/AcrR family transcriptional regulator [Georgenia wutianyii]
MVPSVRSGGGGALPLHPSSQREDERAARGGPGKRERCVPRHLAKSCTRCRSQRRLTAMSEPAGRRELNKARTRQALVEAARELAREHGLEDLTAEEIAARAGVSRRTFFNYFPGIEGVVAAGLAEPLQRIAAELLARPGEEEPLTAIAAALREQPVPAEILLDWAPPGPVPAARGRELHLRVWRHHEEWLVGVLRERLGDDDELRVRTLAAAVMALFEVVQRSWLPTAADLAPDEAVASFNEALLRALAHADAGWRRPTT